MEQILKRRQAEMMARIREKWTDAELDILKANYQTHNLKDLTAMLPGKTHTQIAETAKRLGLKRTEWRGPKSSRKWTNAEQIYLQVNYGKVSMDVLTANLPGRTADAIKIQARKLDLVKKYNKTNKADREK